MNTQVNSDINEKIIEKIKKLLELASSSNEHEAALAMEQARKMMAKYSLDHADILDQEQIWNSIESVSYTNPNFTNPHIVNAMPSIIASIGPIFGVYGMIRTRHNTVQEFKLFGYPTNIEITKFALDSLIAQGLLDMKRDYKKFRTITFAQSFWSGFARGIQNKFGKIQEQNTGIILYDAVKAHIDKLASGHYHGKSHDGVAFNSGFESGSNASIRSGIGSSNQGKLLK